MDNGPREGLDKFLKAASSEPETVLHYEFMQDYKVLLNFFWSFFCTFILLQPKKGKCLLNHTSVKCFCIPLLSFHVLTIYYFQGTNFLHLHMHTFIT